MFLLGHAVECGFIYVSPIILQNNGKVRYHTTIMFGECNQQLSDGVTDFTSYKYLKNNVPCMSYESRTELYKKIEKIRGRPIISYMMSKRPFVGGVMGIDVIPEICEHIKSIPDSVKEIDLMIASQGGDPNVAWRIICLLRERFEKVGVLIPFDAQSAATILAFGADEILMHPFSCLGPIDSQITIMSNNPTLTPNHFSVEDIKSFLAFVNDDLKLSSEEAGMRSLDYLSKELMPTKLGFTKKSMKFTESLAKKLLEMHMKDSACISSIVEKFNTFAHHGYTVNRKEAKELGLPVSKMEKELEDLMWEIWRDAELEMKCNEPFDPLKIVTSDLNAMKRLNQINHMAPISIENIWYESVAAIVESMNVCSQYKTKVLIGAVRNNDLNIMCNVATMPDGWKSVSGNKRGNQ